MNERFLCYQADVALKAHSVANSEGDPQAIASTRHELARVQGELKKAMAERDMLKSMKRAMARPTRLRTR